MAKATDQAALYSRTSTYDKQNPEMQTDELKEVARAKGLKVYRVYEDRGYSGTTANRPMLKKLMEDVRAGKVSHVLCWRLDRWFRSLREVVLTLSELEELGVTFISVKDNLDLSTSTGRLMANLLAIFSQFEVEVIRERVRSGLAHARSKGRVGGRPSRIDSGEVVRLRSQGLSLNEIGKRVGATKSAVSKTLRKAGKKNQ